MSGGIRVQRIGLGAEREVTSGDIIAINMLFDHRPQSASSGRRVNEDDIRNVLKCGTIFIAHTPEMRTIGVATFFPSTPSKKGRRELLKILRLMNVLAAAVFVAH